MKNCLSCKYCGSEEVQVSETEMGVRYFCRYNPPQMIFLEDDIYSWFPYVTEHMWCGKHDNSGVQKTSNIISLQNIEDDLK